MATALLSQYLPNELIDIIMKKTHQLNLERVNNEFKRFVYNNKVEWAADEIHSFNPDAEINYDETLFQESEFVASNPFADNYNEVFGYWVPSDVAPRDHFEYVENMKIYNEMNGNNINAW